MTTNFTWLNEQSNRTPRCSWKVSDCIHAHWCSHYYKINLYSLATWQIITTHTFMVAENLHAWFSVRVIGWFETKICDPWRNDKQTVLKWQNRGNNELDVSPSKDLHIVYNLSRSQIVLVLPIVHARVSTEMWGHSLPQVLCTEFSSAGSIMLWTQINNSFRLPTEPLYFSTIGNWRAQNQWYNQITWNKVENTCFLSQNLVTRFADKL